MILIKILHFSGFLRLLGGILNRISSIFTHVFLYDKLIVPGEADGWTLVEGSRHSPTLEVSQPGFAGGGKPVPHSRGRGYERSMA